MKKYKLKRWYPSLDKSWVEGDIIRPTKNGYYYNEGKNSIIHSDEVENNPDFWELIVEEKPKPLFITEDGVECFDRYDYIAIGSDFEKRNMRAYNCDAPYSPDVIRFKHESNADEYTWRNKPVFSYEDIIEHAYNSPKYRIFIEKLAMERVCNG